MEANHEGESDSNRTINTLALVRVRPLLDSEFEQKQAITCLNDKTLEVRMSGSRKREKAERVFPPQCTQRSIFDTVEPLISKCTLGYNVTLFTYGQTGSGKTYTMFGNDWSNILRKHTTQKSKQSTFLRSIDQDENHAGLIPRTIHYIFNRALEHRRKHIKVYCSFIQLYNETMMDLFEDDRAKMHKKMQIHENKQDGIYIEGLNEIQVEDVDHCLELMQRGEKNRVVRQTYMNVKSSRSHTIFQMLLEEVFPDKKSYRRMKVNLCDLAGSEKINKNEKIDEGHMQELKNINLSLTVLGKVIGCLSEKDQRSLPPYRESKLTRLLQDSLGGNTYTCILATITSKATCLEQSMATLKFLERGWQIKTTVCPKIYSDNADMRNLQKQITYLKDILKMKKTGVQLDVNLSDKVKQLRSENNKLKRLVDTELVDKLLKENTHLKQELERKKNDELIQSTGQLRTIEYNSPADYKLSLQRNQVTIDHDSSDAVSQNKVIKPQARFTSTKTYTIKPNDSISTNKARSTKFPSIKTISNHRKSPLTILDRIHEIQKTKQANKLKLEHELLMIGRRKAGRKVSEETTMKYGNSSGAKRYNIMH